ncbi:STN domain-containing protein [Sphingomonas phyllosphaerae]|uniref:STN domain-containing protein n=1 Tax=Sphingomonas phyllosphaerae TaxID=257003 RepID=UPI00048A8117|nr:STN domain-containing protein [Sphingomonas phyllosphaerae]
MQIKIVIASVLAATSGSVIANSATAECRPGPTRLQLPGQTLAERIKMLSRATGCTIEANPRQVAGKRASVLRGNVTTDEAIFRSVKGTGLEASPVQGRWQINRDQQHFFAGRIAKSQARIAAGQKAGRLTNAQATSFRRQLAAVREGVAINVRDQGFLSAAELSNYRSTVDRVDQRLR